VCIYLTRVPSSRFESSAEENIWDVLHASALEEHVPALVVGHDGYLNVLEEVGELSALAEPPPPRHRRVLPDEEVLVPGEADGDNVRGPQGDRVLQLQQRQVVLVRKEVVRRVDDLRIYNDS
jgi:hypothetical protein